MINIENLKNRNSTLDIIRIVATISVISIHFFLNTNFYSTPLEGVEMFLLCTMRTFFVVCTPLFMVLTGYLMCNKKISKSYYLGISKTLIIYVLASIACIVFRATYLHEPFNFKTALFSILDFTGAKYAWYIEMYIGLFLLAPFLNLIYNNLKSQRQKQVLLFTFVFLTSMPTLFNMFNLNSAQWWINPSIDTKSTTVIFPDYWSGLYPLTYYFVGAYFREYGMKFKTRTLAITLLVFVFLFGSYNFYRSGGGVYKSGLYGYWYSFEAFILTSLFFQLLSRIKTDKFPVKVKWCLWKISDLTLGIYLLSFIFDKLVYKVLNDSVPNMVDKIPYYFVVVPLIFILSAVASLALNITEKLLRFLFNKILGIILFLKHNRKRLLLQDYLFIILIFGSVIFAFWKCVYGFAGNDEAFYLTVPHRLSLGDAFIRDEWHLSQLSGFLLLPFVNLYTMIFGTTEGIILSARIMYVIIHTFVSVFIYFRIRKYGYMAVFASVFYFIFTPFDIMAYSYNTMGLDLIAVTGVTLGTTSYKKPLPIILSGITFACSVLCCPYLAVVYLLFGLCVALHYIIKKSIFSIELFSIKTFIWFTAGVVSIAIIFLIFVLTRVSLSEIFKYLPHLMTDPEHPQISYLSRLGKYFTSIYNFSNYFKIPLLSYILLLAVMLIDKKRKLHRSLYLIVTVGVVIFCYIIIMPQLTVRYYNALMFPLIFIGITSYILCNKKPKTLFACLFVLGILYSIAITLSSNQYFYVISMAISASNIASLVFLGTLIKEMKESEDNFDYAPFLKYSAFSLVALMLVLQGSFQVYTKAQHCFWEFSGRASLVSKLSDGPAKGIYTTVDNYITYTNIYNDFSKYYESKPKDKILCFTNKTWCYLAANGHEYATLSAWLPEDKAESSIKRLEEYYRLNPEKIPKYIYIPKTSQWDLKNIKSEALSRGYNVLENSISYKLEKFN